MPDSVVPDPEFQPAADLASKRAERATQEYVGRAEREASTLMQEFSPMTGERIHALVTVAWLKGFMTGYGEVVGRLDEITARYEQEAKP